MKTKTIEVHKRAIIKKRAELAAAFVAAGKIDKKVPIPPPTRGQVGKGHYALLRKLKKGDSVVLPVGNMNAGHSAHDVLGKGNYACRTINGKTRVWRIK